MANDSVYSANTITLRTNFNVPPYYDDFDGSRNYVRELFRPGYAVQARELTQMQAILQDQIQKFGHHVFREGSKVLGGQFFIDTNTPYVKVKDTNEGGNTVSDITIFEGQYLTGNTTGLQAFVQYVEDGTESDANTKTLFVRYLNSGTSPDDTVFSNNEVLFCNIGTLVTLGTSPTGKGSLFTIEEGVRFAKQHFIYNSKQSIVLERYSQNPTCKVGFLMEEGIVTSAQDSSLLDPALESSNYSAPGADRFQISPVLVKYGINEEVSETDYVSLFAIRDGMVEEINESPTYNVIRDEIAKRTFDESGDYYVEGLDLNVRESFDNGDNNGVSNTGNSQLLTVTIDPGKAYVKGYDIQLITTKMLETEKSRAYTNVNSEVSSSRLGSYVLVDECVGVFGLDTGKQVILYDAAQDRVSSNKWSVGAQTGNAIGLARIKSFEYDSGTQGTANARYRLYLTDVSMNGTNTFASVKSIFMDNPSVADAGADVVLTSGAAVLVDTASPLLFKAANYVRTIRDSSGNPDTTFVFKRTTDVTISSTGTFSLSISQPSEEFEYSTGALSTAEKRDFLLTLNESFNVAMVGTVSNTSSLVAGVGTYFTRLNVGDKIGFSGNGNVFVITAITNDTSMATSPPPPTGLSGAAYYKLWKTGEQIDLTLKGSSTGATRTATGISSTQINFDIDEDFGGTKSGTIGYRVARTSAREVAKTLRNSRFVKINCANNISNTRGPFCLGFSDVYQIRSVRKNTGSFGASTEGTDVTDYFVLDTGQKDDFYDLATITPTAGAGLTNTSQLLVELDYFIPDFSLGYGYFSVDSYPVNDVTVSNTTITTAEIPKYVSPVTGTEYDLRNYLDFRPVKTITAADATTVAAASQNPSNQSIFNYDVNGLRLPADDSTFVFDYSYYLARTDIVVMDKDGNFNIVKGVPASIPVTPLTPDNTMALGRVNITPYPSLSPAYARTLNRFDLACSTSKTANKRFTMKEIGTLKKRIDNLEYYSALNLLEKSAVDLQIVDSNGLDRFKNGIFVDSFANETLSAKDTNLDHYICVDPQERSIRPVFEAEALRYQYISGTNVTKTGDLITLPYTEEVLLTQPYATTFRNNETASFRFMGQLYLLPENDVWMNTQWTDAIIVRQDVTGGQQAGEIISTVWGAWQTTFFGMFGFGGGGWGVFVTDWAGTRQGVQTYRDVVNETTSLGERLIDVSLATYVRAQIVYLNAKGLKPSTKHFVFFDGERMNEYTTPATPVPVPITQAPAFAGAEGAPIISDANGDLGAFLRIPSPSEGKQFRVGEKQVIVTDSPTNDTDATSAAAARWLSQGLTQTKQETILSTRKIVQKTRVVREDARIVSVLVFGHICTAYSFIARAPEGEEGVYLTGFDVYFAAKDPNYGVWFELREMDNSGNITKNSVPFSEVWVDSANMNVSDDASLATNVDFHSPVFLYNNREYALVIHVQAGNPNTYIWVSALGQNDVQSGAQVSERVMQGALFVTNNDTDWDIVPRTDLKMTLYRAKFNTAVSGQAILANEPVEIFRANNMNTSLSSRYGEPVSGRDVLTLSAANGTITTGDYIIGITTGANSAVAGISGADYTVSNTGYSSGESVGVVRANGLATIIGATVSSITRGRASLRKYKERSTGTDITLFDSNGKFTTGDTIRTLYSQYTATIESFSKLKYSVIDFEPSFLNFSKTTCKFEMQNYSNTGVMSSYTELSPNKNYILDTENVILSHSQEIALLGASDYSNKVRITMTTSSDFQTPVIDVGRSHSIYVHNIINSNTLGESATSGGLLTNKYISKTVTLDEGQDAEDLQVIVTGYRPSGTNIKVWAKVRHNEDSTTFEQRPWCELDLSSSVYSSLSDLEDYKEYTYTIPTTHLDRITITNYISSNGAIYEGDYITWGTTPNTATVTEVQQKGVYLMDDTGFYPCAANVYFANGTYKGNVTIGFVGKTPALTGSSGELVYVTDSGQSFTGFKQFALKIGLTSDNSAIIPRAADVRAIALQI